MTAIEDDAEPFPCPRCGHTVQERFWGPCRSCREQLVAHYHHEPGRVADESESTRFEPAMHVVPNHVATKD